MVETGEQKGPEEAVSHPSHQRTGLVEANSCGFGPWPSYQDVKV